MQVPDTTVQSKLNAHMKNNKNSVNNRPEATGADEVNYEVQLKTHLSLGEKFLIFICLITKAHQAACEWMKKK